MPHQNQHLAFKMQRNKELEIMRDEKTMIIRRADEREVIGQGLNINICKLFVIEI